MNEDQRNPGKVIELRRQAKEILQEDKNIDLNAPVLTVFGVQAWQDSKLIGTSLYSSMGKARYVKQTLEEGERKTQETSKEPVIETKYRIINYPVY